MKRLIVWGGREDLSSHRWIQRAFYETAVKLGIDALWLANESSSAGLIRAGDRVLTADLYSAHLPYVAEVDYCLHNFDGAHPICQRLEATPGRLLRLQVWTNEAMGEQLGPCRSFHKEARTLFQPWGCDLLAEEFLDPVYNPQSQDVAFVGAIWSDIYQGHDLGNSATIDFLRLVCADRALRFQHLTHVTDEENIRAVREARLAPAFAGGWQVEHGYLPCRAFKNPAYGALSITNVVAMQELLGETHPKGTTIEAVFEAALALRRDDYLEMVREQQRIVARFTYRESLEAIDLAFAAIQ